MTELIKENTLISFDKFIHRYKTAYKYVLYFDVSDSSQLFDDENSDDTSDKSHVEISINKNTQLKDLVCKTKSAYEELFAFTLDKHDVNTSYPWLSKWIHNSQIINCVKLNKNKYDKIITLFEHIKENTKYKTEYDEEKMDQYLNDMRLIIHFYMTNKLPILERYKFQYNLAFMMVINFHLQNNKLNNP